MVSGLVIAITLLSGPQELEDDIAPLMKETGLPKIASVRIAENGAVAPAAADISLNCSAFQLRKKDVVEYLRKAKEVSQADYLHTLDWSPCFASGTVTFANGLTGTWGIQQLRAGSLKFTDGRTLYLYCPTCRSRVFRRASPRY